MPRPGQRLHRLPHRLDYTLIPAPLDLSLPLATEKSSLPAIIVTPSSPSSTHDFSIAFLAPPQKPTLRERLTSYAAAKFTRARTPILVCLVIFILVCHIATARIATRRPHLEFSVKTGEAHIVDPSINWFNFRSLIGGTTESSSNVDDGATVEGVVDPFTPPLTVTGRGLPPPPSRPVTSR